MSRLRRIVRAVLDGHAQPATYDFATATALRDRINRAAGTGVGR